MRIFLNFLILQWVFIRLGEVVLFDTEATGYPTGYESSISTYSYKAILYFVLPLSGWFGGRMIYLGKQSDKQLSSVSNIVNFKI